MDAATLARIERLDAALAAGRISRLEHALRWLKLGEERAAALIAATPENQWARLERQAEDQRASRPRPQLKYHD